MQAIHKNQVDVLYKDIYLVQFKKSLINMLYLVLVTIKNTVWLFLELGEFSLEVRSTEIVETSCG